MNNIRIQDIYHKHKRKLNLVFVKISQHVIKSRKLSDVCFGLNVKRIEKPRKHVPTILKVCQ